MNAQAQSRLFRKPPATTVAVVGASASGLLSALTLARERREVHVYERSATLAPPPRTLVVTQEVIELVPASARAAVVHSIDRYQLFAGDEVVNVGLGRPDLIIERAQLIRHLAEEARSAGVLFHFGRKLTGIESTGRGLRLVLETSGGLEYADARVVIGADGLRSAVGRAIGVRGQSSVPLIQAVVPLPPGLSPDTARVWFRTSDTSYFYWLIPESPTRAVLGLIGDGRRSPRSLLEDFLRDQGLRATEFQAARAPAYAAWVPPRVRLGSDDVFLVGDAGGHVKVSTVGGLVTGFHGALAAAATILGRSARRRLRRLQNELNMHLLVRRVLTRFDDEDYARLLRLVNGRVQRALGRHSRDRTSRLLITLLAAQPRLLGFAMKSIPSVARASIRGFSTRASHPDDLASEQGVAPAWSGLRVAGTATTQPTPVTERAR